MADADATTTRTALDQRVRRVGFWSAVVVLLATVPSFFFPLDAPQAAFADRMLWFSDNLGSFVTGWVLQMVLMLTLTAVYAAIAWEVRRTHPLSAFIAGVALFISLIAFIIPKFIALWSIPQMVTESAAATPQSAVAEQLFRLLNPTTPYTLFTSFDYLGFWMYAVFGLFVAVPLMRRSLSAKIAGAAFALCGVAYHLLFFGVMAGSVDSAGVLSSVTSILMLLLVPVVSMVFYLKKV